MFVRKGTIRKQRGGSGRRKSTRRPRQNSDGNINGGPSWRQNTKHDQSPPRSPFCLSPNPESSAPLASCSSSTVPTNRVPSSSTFEFASTSYSPRYQATNNFLHAARPNQETQARTVDTVVCMGEGRRLVRTEGIHDDGEDYTAFMFQVREAGKEASNVYDLSCRLADIMCSSLCVTVFVGVSMAIPLTMFSIGVKYWEDCPKDERVPVYLIVGGVKYWEDCPKDARVPLPNRGRLLRCMGEGRRLMRTEGIHDDGKVYTTFMFQVREAGKEACNVFHLSCQLANIIEIYRLDSFSLN
ncbi:hypothetical protein MAR_022185 [Mya arenaria]|uniref:Uncharacterized protein n=1 Tax=Mya arenaria TaxID=6604 RepID=A0ABY7DJD2_MYAAR|nr:hypothetical protein MAR_022185 [Mya arenaria]